MKATQNQIRKFYALLGELGLRQEKENLLSGFGVDSTKDLKSEDMIALLERLEKMKSNKVAAPAPIRKQRSIVLDLLTQMGIYTGSKSWSSVNAFLLQDRIAGKLMYEMDEEELKGLQLRLRAIIFKNSKHQKDLDYLAKNN